MKIAKSFKWISHSKCDHFNDYHVSLTVCSAKSIGSNKFAATTHLQDDYIKIETENIQLQNESQFIGVENAWIITNVTNLSSADRIIFFSCRSSTLFPTKRSNKILSGVLGIEISSYENKQLKNPIITILHVTEELSDRKDYECKSWDFRERHWSKDTCTFYKYSKKKVFCKCWKLSFCSVQSKEVKSSNPLLLVLIVLLIIPIIAIIIFL